MDAHHRRAHAHAGHQGLESALEGACSAATEVADIGGRTTHVEADDAIVPSGHGRAHHANDAAGRARQDGVLALEAVRLGQAPAALHEEQAHPGHLRGHAVHVAAQDGAEVGIHHGGVAARHQLHHRADLVRHAHLGEAHLARDTRRRGLMRAEAPAVQEDDGAGADAGVQGLLQRGAQCRLVQRRDQITVRAHAFLGLRHLLVQQFGQQDAAVEQARPGLVGNAQGVAETPGGDQQRRFTLALQQRVGGHRGTHLDTGHLLRRHRLAWL